MNIMTMLRLKNKWLGQFMPNLVAKQNAKLFMSPKKYPIKEWEKEAEKEGIRVVFAETLSAIRWGQGKKRVLLMHGWEGRATQLYAIAKPLVENGYEVIAIDGPMHGHSKGEKANPVEFANAVVAANKTFGPFYGAIGHSMGACALAMAYEKGADLGRYALLASPARIDDVLRGFAFFMALSEEVRDKFIERIEQVVGRPAKELDVGRMLASHQNQKLLIHAKDDVEIPYRSMLHIRDALTNVRSLSPIGVGHRRIIRDKDIANALTVFMDSEALPDGKGEVDSEALIDGEVELEDNVVELKQSIQ